MLDGSCDDESTDILVIADPKGPRPKDKADHHPADLFRAAMMLNFHAGLFISARLLGLR